MAASWSIEEYDSTEVAAAELSEEDVDYLRENLDSEIDITPPWTGTDGQWVLYNNGYIGHIQLPSGNSIELAPRTDMGDVFGMLEYAYDLDVFQLDEDLYDSDTVEGFYDKVANILAQGVNKRRREGLYQSYQDREERTQKVRGRIDFRETLKKPWSTDVAVKYREMTADNEENQILLYTLYRVSRSGFARDQTLERTRQAIRSLRDVIQYKEFKPSDCTGRQYNRLNQDYERLHALCRLILDTSGPSQESGDARMVPYRVRAFDLYELFVYRWLKRNLSDPYEVDFQDKPELGSTGLNYEIDDVIKDGGGQPVCVLDTKYREPDKNPKSEEVSQVLGYAKRKNVEHAFLVYPRAVGPGFPLELGGVQIHTAKFGISGDLEVNGEAFLEQVSGAMSLPSLQT